MSQWKFGAQLMDTKVAKYLLGLFGMQDRRKDYTDELQPESHIMHEKDLKETFRKIQLQPKEFIEKPDHEKKKMNYLELYKDECNQKRYFKQIKNWVHVSEYGNNIIKRTRHCDAWKRSYVADGVILTLDCDDVSFAQAWKLNEKLGKYDLADWAQASTVGYRNESVKKALEYRMGKSMFDGQHKGKTIDMISYRELLI
jgi:hypothetical protein